MVHSWVLLLSVCFLQVYGKRGPVMESRLENFQQCPAYRNTTILFKDNHVKRISASESRLYGKLVFQDDLEDISGRIEMSKCASKSEPDTCEYYTTIKLGSLCNFIKEKKEPWYGYYNGTTAPKECPLKKGNYDMKGVKIGLTNAFPLFNGFWRFRTRWYDPKNKIVGCFICEMNIVSRFKI